MSYCEKHDAPGLCAICLIAEWKKLRSENGAMAAALEEIAFLGTDVAAANAGDGAEFHKSQLHRAIGIAARVLSLIHTEGGG